MLLYSDWWVPVAVASLPLLKSCPLWHPCARRRGYTLMLRVLRVLCACSPGLEFALPQDEEAFEEMYAFARRDQAALVIQSAYRGAKASRPPTRR